MDKNYYYQKSLQILNELKNLDKNKPTLAFHVCCGPCSLYPLEMLSDFFEITVLYNNSNIFPREEFDKRFIELKSIVDDLNKRKNLSINIVTFDYDYETYMKDLLPYKDQPEGRERCHICYKKRMVEAFEYAKENSFDYVTTSLTSSRQKSSFVINQIGEEISKNAAKPQYFYSDFKKKAWSEIGYKLAREKGIYLQDYCGCEYSLEDSIKRKEQKQASE